MKDLHLVELAVALGRHRNFARAAESMRVTQPTFSRGIARLEKSLGARLFDRSTRRVEPTAVGRAFLERAESLLREAARLTEVITSPDEALSGQLTIGSGPYPLEFSVLPAVARLAVKHPKLRIRVVEGPWREFPALLLQGSVDVVVVEASIFADDQRVEVELLPTRQGALYCRPGHPLTRLPSVKPEDLDAYPLVGISMTRGIRVRVGATARLTDVDRLTGDVTPIIATSSLCATREIVRRTDGVAILLPSQVRDEVRAGRLALLRTDFELPSTGYGMAILRGRDVSLAARAFMEVLRQVEEQHGPGSGFVASVSPARRTVRGQRRVRRRASSQSG